MENSKIRCTHTPEHECKQKQDCECVRCIDIEINQFNPKKTSRRLPRLSRISRPINNRQKEKDEIYNINIKLEQKELNDQDKQSQINRLNGKTKKIEQLLNEQTKGLKQREQIKKLKED